MTILFACIAYFVVAIVAAGFMEKAAKANGYGENTYAFTIAFWLGIFGCYYIMALPDLVPRERNQKIIDLLSSNGIRYTKLRKFKKR